MRLFIGLKGRAEPAVVDADMKALLRRAVKLSLLRMRADSQAEIGLTLTDDRYIRVLNRAYRGQDRPTDVLSFPLGEGLTSDTGETASGRSDSGRTVTGGTDAGRTDAGRPGLGGTDSKRHTPGRRQRSPGAEGRGRRPGRSVSGTGRQGPRLLGDIVISTERAAAQARAYGHSLERELAFLTVHGMLHLLGLDHQQPAERARMEMLQRQIMALLGLPRGKP